MIEAPGRDHQPVRLCAVAAHQKPANVRRRSREGCAPGSGEAVLRYYLDTEFNGFGGALISLALAREDGASLYLVYAADEPLTPWVRRHVMPRLDSIPPDVVIQRVDQSSGARAIAAFLEGDRDPKVIADWPDDIRLFCQALMLRPGASVLIERLSFEMLRVESYPTDLPGVIEHNAWWDAMALRQRLMQIDAPAAPVSTV